MFHTTDRSVPDKLAPEWRCAAPPPPRSVELALAQRGRDMDAAFYRRIVREMRELGIDELGLACLGEPCACRGLAEAVRYAKEDCGYGHVYVTTDGGAAVAPRVRACMEAGLDGLEFRVGFDRVAEDLEAARRVRDEVAAATGHRCEVYPALERHKASPPCAALFAEGHVTCDGRLAACSAHPDPRFDMGDLVHHGFMRVWHGEPFRRLRRAHLAGAIAGTACEGYCGPAALTPPGPPRPGR